MPELGPYGSVRGALSNERPYRDPPEESYPPAGAGPGMQQAPNQPSRKRTQIPTPSG
jgi:hypothetical protein